MKAERTEITTPEPLSEDQAADPGLRPHRLSEFVGQEKVREALTIAVDAAKQRREPLVHRRAGGGLVQEEERLPGAGLTVVDLAVGQVCVAASHAVDACTVQPWRGV